MSLKASRALARRVAVAASHHVCRPTVPLGSVSTSLDHLVADSPILGWKHSWRSFSTIEAAQSQIDDVNEMFAEARDIIEDARDEAETVYFNDAHAEAKEAVGNCLDKFNGIIESLSADEKGKLQRSMGLKIEQLKAELEELDHLHA